MKTMKPLVRSKLRILCGSIGYTALRYVAWHFGNKRYAKGKCRDMLPHEVFAHKTPLLRELKNVDMWLQHNKIHNLRIASRQIDGILLQPGETFSYWKLIGNPTKGKGYVKGMVLSSGGFKAGTGGGLCQLSNLIYWMTIHTPLSITERHRHSYDVFPDANRTQPFGSGATCVFNYRDLQIRNDTNQTYQLILYMTDSDLCGQWRSTEAQKSTFEVYEKAHQITHEYWGGYIRHNLLHRKEYAMDGTVIEDAYLTENHAVMMYQPFLSDGSV